MAISVKANTILAHFQNALRGGQRCVAVGNDGIIWIAYGHWNNPSDGILVAYSSDGGLTWTEEVATAERCFCWDGISLVIDSNNVPSIIYSYVPVVGNALIRYITRTGGVWSAPETVVDMGGALSPWVIKAVIDSTDTIHIVYQRATIRYIVGTAGAWSPFEVATALGITPDLAINNSDEPVVVYIGAGGTEIIYRTGGVWTAPDIVDVPGGGGGTPIPVIQIDSVGDYHVAWQDEEVPAPWDYYVYYRKKESGVWLAKQSLAFDSNQWYVGLGLDDEDNAYVFYQYQGADEAVYYRKVTTGTILGAQTVIDAGILRPNNNPSTFSFLYHKYPANGVLAAAFQPVVVLLDEAGGFYADVYFYAASALSFTSVPTAETRPATEVT
ncbi:MAG: hypothetical protein PHQ43_06435 [Dehalococcoidales bacterium]|nr:hypothetical protein [Dehalococcoidales bacterium]